MHAAKIPFWESVKDASANAAPFSGEVKKVGSHQIAAYGGVKQWAEAMGNAEEIEIFGPEAPEILSEFLDREKAADNKHPRS
jgi:ferritin-like metal-binding protein YciE